MLERKGSLDIKIADFGLALQISPGQRVQTLVGTAEYVGKYMFVQVGRKKERLRQGDGAP